MEKKQPTFGVVATIIVVILLIPFIYPTFFTFPEGDDFGMALKSNFFFDFISGFEQMGRHWWTWSGRYSHIFTYVFLGEACYYRIAYTLVILFSFFILWLSVFGIAKELGKESSNSQPAFIATFWLFAVLCSYRTIHQWYVLVDLVSLIYGYSFTLLYIWSLCRLWNRTTITRSVKWFPIICCVIASGFYEHSALLVLIVTTAAWLLAVIYDHPNRKIYFLLLKTSIVCFLLVYLARGNFRRQTKRGVSFVIMLEQLLQASRDWWTYIVPAYRNPIYLAAFFVAVWLPPRWKTPLTAKISPPLILGGSLVLFLGYSFALTIVHALSDVTVGDTHKIPENIAQYSVIFMFFGIYACRDALRLYALRSLGKVVNFSLILAILMMGNSNFFPVLWNGIFGEITRYAEAYEKRKTVLSKNKNGEVSVMPLRMAPIPIMQDTFREGFRTWPNNRSSHFYGPKALEARSPEAIVAYGVAFEEGRVAWPEATAGIATVYVSSLDLIKNNESYRFDWIFIKSDGSAIKNVRVAAFDKNWIAEMLSRSPSVLQRILTHEWPFRRIFQSYRPQLFEISGRKFYAVPLPLLDSCHDNTVEKIFVSIDGQSFFPVNVCSP